MLSILFVSTMAKHVSTVLQQGQGKGREVQEERISQLCCGGRWLTEGPGAQFSSLLEVTSYFKLNTRHIYLECVP